MAICEATPGISGVRVFDPTELALLTVDLDACDRNDVVDVLDAARRLRSKLDAIEVRAHRRLRELASVGSAEPPDAAVAAAADGDGRHGRQVAERDELCLDAPAIEDALDEGSMSGAHLDALTSASKDLPDHIRAEFLSHSDALVGRAGAIPIDSFRRECRQLAKHLLAEARIGSDADELVSQRAASKVSRWVDKVTGMHHTLLALDPVRDAEVFSATARELARMRQVDGNRDRTWKQLEVEAWVNCLLGSRTTPTGEPSTAVADGRTVIDRAPQVIAITDVAHLRAHATRTGLCETSDAVDIPVSTLRRMCCDAEVIPIVMDGPSRVLDLGRSKRTATAEQRHALRAMHSSCAFPSCGMGFDSCRIHHVNWWTRDVGPTDIGNLAPVCEHHHHSLHEGGWELSLDQHRVGTWTRPDRVVHHVGPTNDRIP